MKYQRILKWFIPAIVILASFAAGMGLFYHKEGAPFTYTNHRGETVTINGQGLYYYDTVSSAAQTQANDLVILLIGIPLLIVATWWAFKGSLRAQLLLTGTLGFFLYTYMSMACLAAFNALFLVYVAIFTLSLYSFILCLLSFDLATFPQKFSPRLPRGWIAGFLFFVGGFLLIAWLGRIIPPLLAGTDPVLENTTSLVIQFMDLSLIVPLTFSAGILLIRRRALGYLLSSVALIKGLTLGLGVSAMSINIAIKGVPDKLGITIPFLVITLFDIILTIALLRNIKSD